MNREEAHETRYVAQAVRYCDCYRRGHPPCSFCEEGFSLELEEYLDLYAEDEE